MAYILNFRIIWSLISSLFNELLLSGSGGCLPKSYLPVFITEHCYWTADCFSFKMEEPVIFNLNRTISQ
jgi:hypothetical protein